MKWAHLKDVCRNSAVQVSLVEKPYEAVSESSEAALLENRSESVSNEVLLQVVQAEKGETISIVENKNKASLEGEKQASAVEEISAGFSAPNSNLQGFQDQNLQSSSSEKAVFAQLEANIRDPAEGSETIIEKHPVESKQVRENPGSSAHEASKDTEGDWQSVSPARMGKPVEKKQIVNNNIEVSHSRFSVLADVDGEKSEENNATHDDGANEVEEGELVCNLASFKAGDEKRDQLGIRPSLP